MKKNVKIAIGVAGLVGAGVVGYFIWKAVQEKNGSGSGTTSTGNDGQPVTVRNIRQLNGQRKWIPIVSLARKLRNNIAHYNPISYNDFEKLLRKIHEFEESNSAMNFYH